MVDVALLDTALTGVRAELVRVDAKAGTLLSLAGVLLGGGLALLAGTGGRLHVAVTAPAWVAAAAVGVATVQLASAVRPNLRGVFGFVRWCRTASAQQLVNELAAEAADPVTSRADQLRWLSCAAAAKYTAIQRSVTMLLVGLGAATLAAAAAMVGW